MTEPAAPPWVNPDGTVDYSLMPEEIPLIGEDGLPLLDEDGNVVVMTREEAASPPPVGRCHHARATASVR